jgi:hypothetical protein
MKQLTKKWIIIGENELGYAKLGFEADSFYSQICVQSHQAFIFDIMVDLKN